MKKKMVKGSAVEVTGYPHLRGTVTQIRKRTACVLFPIRSFAWFPIDRLRVVGFDGDGSSVGWR